MTIAVTPRQIQWDNRDDKRLFGQFFTVTNPFINEPFVEWLETAVDDVMQGGSVRVIEPFAGSNNIIAMVRELDLDFDWGAYDIEPVNEEENAAPDIIIERRNTIADFPKGFSIAITNPPYLAKNSATRRGLKFDGGRFDDVYQNALSVMLENVPYVAAIIPESFLTQGLFHARLTAVVSLTCRMFDDTDAPVCLALFVPAGKKKNSDFSIYGMDRHIGTFASLRRFIEPPKVRVAMRFNDLGGQIGLSAIDNTKTASIRFVKATAIAASDIKDTGRAKTRIRIDIEVSERDVERLIATANDLLRERRKNTGDVFLTPFKGLRADGCYRRRLDFAQARDILNLAAVKIGIAK